MSTSSISSENFEPQQQPEEDVFGPFAFLLENLD
jgi:hypothetical protein